jgi:uncharacterized protein
MRLSDCELEELEEILKDYRADARVQKMKKFIQHGVVSTYDHCDNVTRVSYWIDKRLHLHSDEEALVTGAFLHDFYLYDWHEKNKFHSWHGFFHPQRACKYATRYFDINEKEQQIIKSHMWPLTLRCLPKSREAVIVSVADKLVSAHETLFQRNKIVELCK